MILPLYVWGNRQQSHQVISHRFQSELVMVFKQFETLDVLITEQDSFFSSDRHLLIY